MKQILMACALMALTTACNSQKQTATPPEEPASTTRTERTDRSRNQQGPPSMEKVFEMDANKDGKLSKAEVKGKLLNDFSKIDTNADGFITKEELEKAPKPQRGQRPPRNN